ncbi:MAG: PfkB family carbohydrate kinase, partial [Pseudomonadota bacterium]
MSVAVHGEALIDFLESGDGTYRPHPGGSPFNVAVGLARQGMDVSYLSPLSEDGFGDQLRDILVREGVALPLTRRSPLPTSLALVALDPHGAATYRLYCEAVADKDISFEQLRDALPPATQVFHTGSLAIIPSQLPKIRSLFRLLRDRGVLISVDINIRLRACADIEGYLQGVRSLIPLCDIVKASDEDLAAIASQASAQASAEALRAQLDGGIVLLTQGKGGALVLTGQGDISRDAFAAERVADTVGAGDTFHGAFLAALLRSETFGTVPVAAMPRETLRHALDFACAAAAINVSRTGCSPPSHAEV